MAKRILVIDDEPGIIAFFKAWGYEVETSRDASEGLKMLEKDPMMGSPLD